MPYELILRGITLAATAGLRVFMPFLFVGGLGRYAHTPTPDILAWTATDAGFLLLLTATLLEFLGDKIRAVDHALDMAATFLKPAAGFVLPAALLTTRRRRQRGCSALARVLRSRWAATRPGRARAC